MLVASAQAQHNNELYNKGAEIHVQAGAEMHVRGDVHMIGATATLHNDGLIQVQGNSYSDALFQQRGTGTYRIANPDVNTGERQFISGSFAVRGGQTDIGVDDGSFYNLELDNDQGIVYLVGTGFVADVRNSVDFKPGTFHTRIVTHDVGISGALSYPANGSDYDATFGVMNNSPGNSPILNSAFSFYGANATVDSGYVQGRFRRAIRAAGGNYNYVVGLEPGVGNANRGFQNTRLAFGVNTYDVVDVYFENGMDNTIPGTNYACGDAVNGYLLDYWSGSDFGQHVYNNPAAGSGTYTARSWPQDGVNPVPAKTVFVLTQNNALGGTLYECGGSAIGLSRSGYDGINGTSFGFAGGDLLIALPVELLEFRVKSWADHLHPNWKVASETNVSHYVVERSTNGKDFEAIASLNAAGTTSIGRSYGWKDYTAQPNQQYYYRFHAFDFDGYSEYSPIATGRLHETHAAPQVTVYPNPSSGAFQLTVQNAQEAEYRVQVFNALGQQVTSRTIQTSGGLNSSIINTEAWPKGVYTLSLQGNASTNPLVKRIIRN